jgi:hypothetical protein
VTIGRSPDFRVAVLGRPDVPFDRELVEQSLLQHELLQGNRPAVPVRTIGLGRYRGDVLLAKWFAVTVEARLVDCGAKPEHTRLPRCFETELAVASRRSGDTVDVE